MKRLALLVTLLLAVPAALAADSYFSVATSTSTTAACLGLTDAGQGADLSNAVGFNVVLSADRPDGGSQTLIASSGTMNCCAYLPVSSGGSGTAQTRRWMDCPSTLDITLSAICPATGARDCPSGDFEPLAGMGRVMYLPSAVVVDGGVTVTTTINVRRRQ